MNRLAKWLIALLCTGLFVGAFALAAHSEFTPLPAVGALDEAEYADLVAAQREVDDRAWAGGLLIGGKKAPFDSLTNAYYVPETMDSPAFLAALTWSARGFTAYFCPDALLNDKLTAIRESHAFRLVVSDGRRYHYETVVFTGLPAITLRTESEQSFALGEGVPTGELCSFEPDEMRYNIVASLATFRERGNTTAQFEKTPLRVTLYHPNRSKNYASLAGLRADDDWILNSLYTDRSKLRDYLCATLWNAVTETNPASDVPGTRMRYVEVFIDDVYFGLYGLMEPIGKKSTNLDTSRDILYQAKSFLLLEEDFAKARNTLGFFAVEIQYPKVFTGPELWDPITRYVDSFTWHPDSYTTEQLLSLIDLANAVDHSLFYQATVCTDNFFHNNFYLARAQSDGGYRFIKIPWDMNYSFGDKWNDHQRNLFTEFDDTLVSSDASMPDIKLLLQRDPAGMGARLSARWLELRNTALSDEAVFSLLDGAEHLVTDSGAMLRDNARWPDAAGSDETQRVRAFAKARLAYLDEYYRGLAGEKAAEASP